MAKQVIRIRYADAKTDDEAARLFDASKEWSSQFAPFHFLPTTHALVGDSDPDSWRLDWRIAAQDGSIVTLCTDNLNVVFLSILHDLAKHAQHHDWATHPSRNVVYAVRGLRIFIEEDTEFSSRDKHFHPHFSVAPVSKSYLAFVGKEITYASTASRPWHPGAGNLLRAMLDGAERQRFLTEVVKSEQLQEGKVDSEEREERLARTARACTKAFEFWEAYWTAYTLKHPQEQAAA
ncbi:uncharacterized protein JCM10292_002174 [Rhodotorula paludigena]|uniref:uncharacterized protein n=1 Tax=Rhodotorula paludigena TaxID=86838 RepID=UPI0031743BF0